MENELTQLRQRLGEISDISSASSVLYWDQSTYMPPGGAPARGRQMATLRALAHQKFTDPEVGKLLDALEPQVKDLPYDSFEASLIRVTRRKYERAVRVPESFVAAVSKHSSASYTAWVQARAADDFAAIQPYLEKTVDYSRQYAEFFPGYEDVMDPLIDVSDPGMKATRISALFQELRQAQLPIVHAILAQEPADDSCLWGAFPEEPQRLLGERVAREFGYDFQRGRLDKTAHPFMIKFSLNDVRITTRYRTDFLGEGLFSTMHETGHALYEQGIDPSLEATPLGSGASSGVHESQSRLWENMVGRSLDFWQYAYPFLQEAFPSQLDGVELPTFYRAINKVSSSLIRTDADEVTYNLHVMMRFDFERELLHGRLAVADLPEAWRARMKADLGVEPPNDKDGVLQDVHWFSGLCGGAFQSYTLGNIMAAQFYATATEAVPDIPNRIQRGEFSPLLDWLTDHIYVWGAKLTPDELVERVTGGPIRIEPYIEYLRQKFGAIYQL